MKDKPQSHFGKKFCLSNVLYLLKMHKNFISGFLLNRVSIKLMFWFDKLISIKGDGFISQGCAYYYLHLMEPIIL